MPTQPGRYAQGARQAGRYVWGPRRMAAGLSLKQLSDATGINRGDLSKAENGRIQVPSVMLEKVLKVLTVAPQQE